MSVLLEALKKAAEEKNKSSHQEVEPSIPVMETGTGSTLTLKPVEEESFHSEPPEGGEPSIEESEGSQNISIKLSTYEVDTDNKKAPSIDDLDLENQVSDQSLEPVIDEVKMEPSNLSAKSLESLPKETYTSKGGSMVAADEQQLKTSETLSNEVVEDSYEWSLGELPGYDGQPNDKTSEASPNAKNDVPNPILTTNKRFRKKFELSRIRRFVFGRSSNLAIYALFSILAISIVGFFSVYYFQQEEVELEQTMRKYNLVRTVLPAGLIEKSVLQDEKTVSKDFTDTGEQQGTLENDLDKQSGSEEAQTFNDIVTSNSLSKDDVLEVLKPVEKPQKPLKVAKTHQTDNDIIKVDSGSSQGALIINQISNKSDIQQAYTALYNGDLETANKSFENILSVEPNNLMVLNGYAATQAQLGNDSIAIDNYKKVLNLDSNNLHAFEALLSILGENLEGAEWKQEVKRVLEIHSDSAVLNYALGNFYAQDSDWKKAQVYYFEAYALDDQNADYAVNLAISLDQLGQYSLSEQYYTLALVHASQASGFDQAQIKQRLLEIKQFMGDK